MNARIIELLQQPSLMQANDLQLLEKQIEHTPYVQNVRALYLYGIHLYNPTRYKEVLTTTAAYTTDKKILYQFINKKDIVEFSNIKSDEKVDTTIETPVEETQHAVSTNIVENLTENKEESSEVEAQQDEDVMNVEEGSKEVVITDHTEPIEIEEELNRDVSFESIDDFLPQVKFEVPKNHHQFLNPPKFEVKEHKPVEIEEKPTGIVIDDTNENIDSKEELNDADSLDFGPFSGEEVPVEVLETEKSEVPAEEHKELEPTKIDVAIEDDNSAWKPMSIDAHQPDALIGKVETSGIVTTTDRDNKLEPTEEEVSETITPQIKLEKPIEEPKPVNEIVEQQNGNVIETAEKVEEEKRPIFNVSFFGDSIAMVDDQKKANEDAIEEAQQKEVEIPIVAAQEDIKPEKSNVRQFINTWQNWLKIDRTAEIEKDKEVKKQKAIDEFIENQPKITQLKDEASFVVKEKKEDISHLMTETLANLYLEQKLYSKAIKAFETLIAKHPEKTDYFTQKIEDIKEQRKS